MPPTNPSPETTNTAPEPAPPSRSERATAWLRVHIRGAVATAVMAAAAAAAVPVLMNWAGDAVSSDDNSPPTCPGAACEGKNANDEGCGVDAWTYAPTHANPVHLQVRYSKRCGAAWGRITNGDVGDDVTIAVKGGGTAMAVISSNHDNFTRMVSVGTTFKVKVCATPTVNPDEKRPWEAYCIPASDKTDWEAPADVSG